GVSPRGFPNRSLGTRKASAKESEEPFLVPKLLFGNAAWRNSVSHRPRETEFRQEGSQTGVWEPGKAPLFSFPNSSFGTGLRRILFKWMVRGFSFDRAFRA